VDPGRDDRRYDVACPIHRALATIGLALAACATVPPAPAGSGSAAVADLPGFRTLTIDEHVWGGSAHVIQAGPEDGERVVLVHGIGAGASSDWHPLMRTMADRYRVTTFDLPGFGRSTRANENYNPTDYAEFVEDVVSQLVEPPFVLIGHSMGGAIAIEYAGKNPRDISKLILADVAGVLHRTAFMRSLIDHSVDEMIDDDADNEGRWQRLSRRVLAPIAPPSLDPAIVATSASKRRIALGADPMKIAGYTLYLTDVGPALDRIAVAPLVIWGTEDTVAPMRTGQVLTSRIRGARLELIEGVGHNVMLEAPERFAALVHAWLDGELHARQASTPPDRVWRIGRCYDSRGLVFEGSYRRIDIHRCRDVKLRNVRVETLRISASTVHIENADIGGRGVGLLVERSEVTMTAGRIRGDDVAIRAESSELDLAGVVLSGRRAAVEVRSNSRALMSVCKMRTARRRGYLHGVYELSPSAPL